MPAGGLPTHAVAAGSKTGQAANGVADEKRDEFVLGREEDAVDRFATFLLTLEGDEDAASDPSTILVDAMRG